MFEFLTLLLNMKEGSTLDFIINYELWVKFEVAPDRHADRQTHQYHDSAWPRGRAE